MNECQLLNLTIQRLCNKWDGVLPDIYQQVLYLQSNAGCYIDTLYIPTVNTSILFQLGFASSYSGSAGLGCYVNEHNSWRVWRESNTIRFQAGSTRLNSGYSGLLSQEYRFQVGNNYIKDVYKNKYLKTGTAYTSNIWTEPLYLFIYKYGTNNLNTSSGLRLRYCQIFESGSLVRNFIPVVKKSNSEAGMFDMVQGKFYTNTGTGTFTVGANV